MVTTMNPQHIAGLPKLLARLMDIDADRAIKFINTCWGKNLQRKAYGQLTKLDGQLVYAAIKDLGLGVALCDWQDNVVPALNLLGAQTLVCRHCGELGIIQSSPCGWQAIREEMECMFCGEDVMLRPETEKAPKSWITGQDRNPGVDQVADERVLIPLTAEGVQTYITKQYGEGHDVDDQFRPYDVLHVLNVLLNGGFRGISTPREALEALVFPHKRSLMRADVLVIVDRIQRDEWLTGRYGEPASPPMTPTDVTRRVDAVTVFDALVSEARKQYSGNPGLINWEQSDERAAILWLVPELPSGLLLLLAQLYCNPTSWRLLCMSVGLEAQDIPQASTSREFWRIIGEEILKGLAPPPAAPKRLMTRGIDKLVTTAKSYRPNNRVLCNWLVDPERERFFARQRKIPQGLRETMAELFTSPHEARELLIEAGYPSVHIPSMDEPIHFWSKVFREIKNGIM